VHSCLNSSEPNHTIGRTFSTAPASTKQLASCYGPAASFLCEGESSSSMAGTALTVTQRMCCLAFAQLKHGTTSCDSCLLSVCRTSIHWALQTCTGLQCCHISAAVRQIRQPKGVACLPGWQHFPCRFCVNLVSALQDQDCFASQACAGVRSSHPGTAVRQIMQPPGITRLPGRQTH